MITVMVNDTLCVMVSDTVIVLYLNCIGFKTHTLKDWMQATTPLQLLHYFTRTCVIFDAGFCGCYVILHWSLAEQTVLSGRLGVATVSQL